MNTPPLQRSLSARRLVSTLHAAVLVCAIFTVFVQRGQAAGAPTITSFSPTSGAVGDTVVINGTNFDSLEGVVFAGNVDASGNYTATQVTVVVPLQAQTGVITVQTANGSASTGSIFTVVAAGTPVITISSGANATGELGEPFSYQIAASNNPASYAASGLPAGLSVNQSTGVISGSPTTLGTFSVTLSATNATGTGEGTLALTVSPLPFFGGEVSLGKGVYYVAFPSGHNFGEYSYLTNPDYIYSYDLTGYEYLIDAKDGKAGIYLYDFTSSSFFYTSPSFPYPYLYGFHLNSVLYFYQGTSNPRYFFDFETQKIISQ